MAKKDRILAVDIGAESLKFAEFEYPLEGGGMRLEKFDFIEYGKDIKDELRPAAVQAAFKEAITKNKFKAKKVNLSISGQSVFIRFVKLPPAAENENKVRQMVEYEAKQNVPFPIDEVVWDYQLIGKSEGDDSEIEVMFVVVKNDMINTVTDCVEGLGMETAVIDVAPTACYNAARANQVGGDECVMILNIGGKTSTLVFIDSGRFYVRSIPIAGYTITQQISKEFGISFDDAEEMKRKHGFVALGGAYEEPESEVSATVSKIVRNVMTRLHGEINRSINVYRAQQKGSKPTKLYLAGGSSVIPYTNRFFQEKLKLPVDYFNPFQVVSIGDEIDKESLAEVAHMFSEVIGLALRGITVCPIEISLIPEILKKQHSIKHKTPYFYATAASMILCMGILWFGVSKLVEMNKQLKEKGQGQNDKNKSIKFQIDNLKDKLKKQQDEFIKATKRLEHKEDWINIVNFFQTSLPDNTWLVELKPGVPPSNYKSEDEKKQEDKGKKSIFGFKSSTAVARTADTKNIEWLNIIGHSLILEEKTNLMENIKSRLLKGNVISTIEEIDYQLPKDDDNVTKFELLLKLTKPIPK